MPNPYLHSLRPLDIEALKCLQTRVNVIPIIAKADTLTPVEVRKLKDQILEDLRVHQIQVDYAAILEIELQPPRVVIN